LQNNTLTRLLGYSDDQIHSVETDYKETWLDSDGVKINILINGQYSDRHHHFISKERLDELVLKNRDLSLDILNEDETTPMETPKWKVGDMCYFDYKVHYISDMWDDRVRGCMDDFGGSGSYDLRDRCFKITPHTMKCSNEILFQYNWIGDKEHLVPTEYIINYPDIHSTLISMWIDLIEGENNHKLHKYGNDIISAIDHENFDLMYFNDTEEEDYRIFREINSFAIAGTTRGLIINEEGYQEETESI
tara:strand:+ start:980 stop:1723 length:744 start_codon:yes stop_codon:yes gene_type:complete